MSERLTEGQKAYVRRYLERGDICSCEEHHGKGNHPPDCPRILLARWVAEVAELEAEVARLKAERDRFKRDAECYASELPDDMDVEDTELYRLRDLLRWRKTSEEPPPQSGYVIGGHERQKGLSLWDTESNWWWPYWRPLGPLPGDTTGGEG